MTDETQNLINIIVQEVLKRLEASGINVNTALETQQKGVLVLVPAFVPDTAGLTSYLKTAYKEPLTCALLEDAVLGDPSLATVKAQTPEEKHRLMSMLKTYKEIVLAVPPTSLLKKIAAGDDTGFVEQLIMRAILWGKKVTCVLDFEAPKFKRSTFFEGICDALDALADMGMNIVSVSPSVTKPQHTLSLITEAEVMDAYKNASRLKAASGAIITPLAKDKAKELDITIVIEGVNER